MGSGKWVDGMDGEANGRHRGEVGSGWIRVVRRVEEKERKGGGEGGAAESMGAHPSCVRRRRRNRFDARQPPNCRSCTDEPSRRVRSSRRVVKE